MNQLFDEEGHLFSYGKFLSAYNIPVTPREFDIVFDAIPSGIMMLFRNAVRPLHIFASLPDPADSPVGKVCFSQHPHSSKDIGALFQKDIVSVPHVMSYWNQLVDNVDWRKVWMVPHKYLILNKVKEVSDTTLLIIMVKYKRDIHVKCCFCKDHSETVLHLFWHCLHTQAFQGFCCGTAMFGP